MTVAACSPDTVVAEARSWAGTPYQHGQSVKGVGCDCIGLVNGVCAEVTQRPLVKTPPYAASWRSKNMSQVILDGMSQRATLVNGEPQLGDLIAFSTVYPGYAAHCGILATDDTFVHVYASMISVAEVSLIPWWRKRIVAAYRIGDV